MSFHKIKNKRRNAPFIYTFLIIKLSFQWFKIYFSKSLNQSKRSSSPSIFTVTGKWQKANSHRACFLSSYVLFSNSIVISAVEKTPNRLVDNHHYDVDNPYDVEAENQTKKSCNDFAFRKSCDCAENPRRNGNDCKNKTYDTTESEIIAFAFCHNKSSHSYFFRNYPTSSILTHCRKNVNIDWKIIGVFCRFFAGFYTLFRRFFGRRFLTLSFWKNFWTYFNYAIEKGCAF